MVKMAAPEAARPAASPGASGAAVQSTTLRKASAVAMIILLYSAASPFNPISWLTYDLEGSFFLDRLVAGAVLFAALYFQWRIAAQTSPVAICLPTGSRQTIRNGAIVTTGSGELVFLYNPVEYWKYVGIEAALLGVAEFGGSEILRRCLVSGVLAGLWAVGWFVTPERIKKEGWEHLKRIWFWIALDEVMRVGSRRGGSHRRRW
jgi:hypothetical protein